MQLQTLAPKQGSGHKKTSANCRFDSLHSFFFCLFYRIPFCPLKRPEKAAASPGGSPGQASVPGVKRHECTFKSTQGISGNSAAHVVPHPLKPGGILSLVQQPFGTVHNDVCVMPMANQAHQGWILITPGILQGDRLFLGNDLEFWFKLLPCPGADRRPSALLLCVAIGLDPAALVDPIAQFSAQIIADENICIEV